jgi:hypothetical protein
MKKIETLKKILETVTDDELKAIAQNDDIIYKSLKQSEKMSLLMFNELERALRTKEHRLMLDCNFADSRNSVLKVDYYRLAISNSMIQIYYKSNNTFAVCTSASKANREKFSQLESDLHFVTKYDSKTQRAKTTQRTAIAYDDIVSVVKQVIAILESTATERATATESDTATE